MKRLDDTYRMFILHLILSFFFLRPDPDPVWAASLIETYSPPRKDYVILIDYSRKISEERLWVIRMSDGKVVIKCRVAHAFLSGRELPTSFSNKVGTKKSCVGAFITLNSYWGRWGYSMKVRGLEPGINDNAFVRSIVFHSDIVQKTTWSEGCFATPHETNKSIIDLTKGGCLVYVYI